MGAGRNADTDAPAQNANQLAEDIGSGWSGNNEPPSDQYIRDTRDDSYADDSLDQGWERPDASYAQADYDRSGYDRSSYARPEYDPPGYDPSAYPRPEYEKKVYGDDLYGVEDADYEEEPIAEGPKELLDSDNVYEADYRVVLPPSRPLETDEDY